MALEQDPDLTLLERQAAALERDPVLTLPELQVDRALVPVFSVEMLPDQPEAPVLDPDLVQVGEVKDLVAVIDSQVEEFLIEKVDPVVVVVAVVDQGLVEADQEGEVAFLVLQAEVVLVPEVELPAVAVVPVLGDPGSTKCSNFILQLFQSNGRG